MIASQMISISSIEYQYFRIVTYFDEGVAVNAAPLKYPICFSSLVISGTSYIVFSKNICYSLDTSNT